MTSMSTVGVRELGKRASAIVDAVEHGDRVVVTKRGRPVAVLSAVSADVLEDFVLAHHDEFVRDMAEAERELAAGRTRSLDEVLADLDADNETSSSRSNRPSSAVVAKRSPSGGTSAKKAGHSSGQVKVSAARSKSRR